MSLRFAYDYEFFKNRFLLEDTPDWNCAECGATKRAHQENGFIKYPTVSKRGWFLLNNSELYPNESVQLKYETCYFFKPKNYQYEIFDFITKMV